MNNPSRTSAALVIIDMQNNPCSDNPHIVSDGHHIVPFVNQLIKRAGERHLSIYATRKNTPDAEFHPEMRLPHGWGKLHVFSEGADDLSPFRAGFAPEEQTLFICGLATDYRVYYTASEALRRGYDVILVDDACRAANINPQDGVHAINEMSRQGARIVRTADALDLFP